MKRRFWTLAMGIAIGVAVTLPLTALASSRPLSLGGASEVTGTMDVMNSGGTNHQMHHATEEDMEKMMEQCTAMTDEMKAMMDMMGNGGMMNMKSMGHMMGR